MPDRPAVEGSASEVIDQLRTEYDRLSVDYEALERELAWFRDVRDRLEAETAGGPGGTHQHHELMARHRRQWPQLWALIDELVYTDRHQFDASFEEQLRHAPPGTVIG